MNDAIKRKLGREGVSSWAVLNDCSSWAVLNKRCHKAQAWTRGGKFVGRANCSSWAVLNERCHKAQAWTREGKFVGERERVCVCVFSLGV